MNKSFKEAINLLAIIGGGSVLVYVGVMSYQCASNSEFTCPPPFSLVFKPKAPSQPTPSETQSKSITPPNPTETSGKSISLSTSAPKPTPTPTPTSTPTKFIPQGEIPASEMTPEQVKSLYTVVNFKYACVKITSSKLIAKDPTGITVNVTCDYQDRYNLIILNKNPPTYQIYPLTADGKFK